MAVDRKTPTIANHGATISGDAYSQAVNEEVEALWDRSVVWLDSVTGTDTITATADPPIEAYTRNQQYNFVPANTNTDAVTIEIDGLPARAIRDIDGVALVGGELVAGRLFRLQDDGTNLRVLNRPPEVASTSVASVATQVFTSSGTYTPNALLIFAKVQNQAPGGGGGGGDSAGGVTRRCGGGGGGGEYAEGYFDATTIGASQAVTIGSVGAAGSNTGGNGGAGGACSLGSLISVNGGAGGTGTGSASSSGVVRAAGAGGTGGTGGHLRIPGSNGMSGFAHAADTDDVSQNNGGGNSFLGHTHNMPGSFDSVTGTAGTAGPNYGAGGAGGQSPSTTGQPGGVGGAPILIITEYLRAP